MKKLVVALFLMLSVVDAFDIFIDGKWKRDVDLKQIKFVATGSEPDWNFELVTGSKLYFLSGNKIEKELSLTISSDSKTIMFSSKDKKVFGKIKYGENGLENGFYTSEIVIDGHYFYEGCTEAIWMMKSFTKETNKEDMGYDLRYNTPT